MSKRLRWKKDAAETGLRRVGAGPRASRLHDGETEYASVHALRRDYRVTGWYWVSRASGELQNTCRTPVPDEATAKQQAMAYVKAKLTAKEPV